MDKIYILPLASIYFIFTSKIYNVSHPEIISRTLSRLVNFNEDQLKLFLSKFIIKKLKKDEFLLREGKVCKAMVIVNRGALRYFGINERGEQSHWFAFEGEWLGDYESFLTQAPSQHYIQALEDTDVFCLTYRDMQQLYNEGANFERFGRLIAEELFISIGRSRYELASLPAILRYKNLIKNYPEIHKRIQIKHLATYLGIQPQSLSRIRKELAKSK